MELSNPLLLTEKKTKEKAKPKEQESRGKRKKQLVISHQAKPLKDFPDLEMERYLLQVGHDHKVKPGNIVGAIANEADIESCYIGNIEIYDDCSTVDLPEGMPRETLNILKKARVCGRTLDMKLLKPSANDNKGSSKPGKKRKKRRIKKDK